MKKFVFGFVATLGLVGFVMAESFNGTISKVDGSKVSVNKGGGGKKGAGAAGGKKGGKKGAGAQPAAPEVMDLAADCVVGKGKQDPDKKGPDAWSLDTKFSDGVKNEAFKDAETTPVPVKITTADEDKGSVKKGQVTEILTITAGKGGGAGKKGAGKKGG